MILIKSLIILVFIIYNQRFIIVKYKP